MGAGVTAPVAATAAWPTLGAFASMVQPSPVRAAAAFRQRPVRIVVPYSVGVGPDVVARSLGERLSQQWGQTVLIDNKPGASGIVAFGEVRRVAATIRAGLSASTTYGAMAKAAPSLGEPSCSLRSGTPAKDSEVPSVGMQVLPRGDDVAALLRRTEQFSHL